MIEVKTNSPSMTILIAFNFLTPQSPYGVLQAVKSAHLSANAQAGAVHGHVASDAPYPYPEESL